MFACKRGHVDVVLTLLDYSSNTDIRSKVSLCTGGRDYVHVCVIVFLPKQDGMTAADVASINLHSDVYHVLQLMAPQDTAATGEHQVSSHSTIGMCFMLTA